MNSGQTSRRQHDFDAEATYTDNVGTEWHIGVEIKKVNGRPGITSMTIWSESIHHPLTRRTLSDLPLLRLFHDALVVESELLSQINRPRRISAAHQGREHSDAELQRVAEVYSIAFKAHLPVQKTVANAFGVSVSAAAKRIMAARSRGFIDLELGDTK